MCGGKLARLALQRDEIVRRGTKKIAECGRFSADRM
jgi:hypothetical protein